MDVSLLYPDVVAEDSVSQVHNNRSHIHYLRTVPFASNLENAKLLA